MVHNLIALHSEFLFGAKHPELILHTTISSKQWASRSHKQDPNHALKKRLEQARRNGSRSYPASYGPTELHPDGQQEILLSLCIWNGCSHSYRNRSPYYPDDAAKQSDANMELGRNLDWTDEVRESGHPDGRLSTKGISTLQSQSEAKKLQKWYASP
ncbi:hypothetical protein CK203_056071 [Vitis vinifera]|uniref:Uncharacterized protein n=1 Tax=Vitis vinifera TaxID=29760 RepID=A0A438G900_VITVI|nr:hypothetical protein CK203_056071 [Vitis vinifera]